MIYNGLEEGFRAPSGLVRPNGSRYLWKKNGNVYIQEAVPQGKKWSVEEPAEFKLDTEVDTGERWFDGKPIYQQAYSGSSFAVSGSYASIPHNIIGLDTFIQSAGYVGSAGGAQYSTYANYVDGLGNFRFFWTAPGNFPYTFFIRYTKQ